MVSNNNKKFVLYALKIYRFPECERQHGSTQTMYQMYQFIMYQIKLRNNHAQQSTENGLLIYLIIQNINVVVLISNPYLLL